MLLLRILHFHGLEEDPFSFTFYYRNWGEKFEYVHEGWPNENKEKELFFQWEKKNEEHQKPLNWPKNNNPQNYFPIFETKNDFDIVIKFVNGEVYWWRKNNNKRETKNENGKRKNKFFVFSKHFYFPRKFFSVLICHFVHWVGKLD